MNLTEYLTNPIFKTISEVADSANLECYVVGGFVRDLLLERKQNTTDIDFVCVGSGITLAKEVAKQLGNKTEVKYFKNFGTAMINYQSECYEFVGSRKESYRANSRKPIVEEGSRQEGSFSGGPDVGPRGEQCDAAGAGAEGEDCCPGEEEGGDLPRHNVG